MVDENENVTSEEVDMEQHFVDGAVNAENSKESLDYANGWKITAETDIAIRDFERRDELERRESEAKIEETKARTAEANAKADKAKAEIENMAKESKLQKVKIFLEAAALILVAGIKVGGSIYMNHENNEAEEQYQLNDQEYEETGHIAINHNKRRKPRRKFDIIN